jgi:rhodanese-related sulfurtransferase
MRADRLTLVLACSLAAAGCAADRVENVPPTSRNYSSQPATRPAVTRPSGDVMKAALATGRLDAVEGAVDEIFADVPQLSTKQLAAMLNDPDPARRPIVLDARAAGEFDVSHLAGARRVDFDKPVPADLLAQAKERPVVVYCSVGYRSSVYARKLREAGVANACNLRGSIFRWATEGRPMVHGESDPAATVHPYNESWGKLIPAELRAE